MQQQTAQNTGIFHGLNRDHAHPGGMNSGCASQQAEDPARCTVGGVQAAELAATPVLEQFYDRLGSANSELIRLQARLIALHYRVFGYNAGRGDEPDEKAAPRATGRVDQLAGLLFRQGELINNIHSVVDDLERLA